MMMMAHLAHLAQGSDDERRQQSSYEHCSSKFGFCWKEENLKILVPKGTFQIGKMTRTRCEECDTLQYP
jgi:hypothetical protein